MSLILYLIGIIMVSVSIGNIYSPAIGFITLGSFFIFIALFEDVMDYLKRNDTA